MKVNRTVSLIAAFVALAIPMVAGAAEPSWKVVGTLPVGGNDGWDYITVDAAAHRLFVTRRTHTQVIDSDSGKALADITGQQVAHGVALVPKLNRGFISDGGGKGAIIVFDMKTYAVLGRIDALPDTDAIAYDAGTNKVLAGAGDSNALVTVDANVDPAHGKVDTIQLGGAPESFAFDGKGKVYINLEDKDVIAVVDLASRSVVARWPVAPGGRPVGMAMDADGKHLFIGCRKPQKLVVMSAADGKVDAALPIGAGVDADAFDSGHAFASCGDGTLTDVVSKNGKFEVAQVVTTRAGARTMGVDKISHKLYLPTAEMEPAQPGKRPQPKPGTFMIVVVSQQ
jgi:outer membrane protein assembly factor BamB